MEIEEWIPIYGNILADFGFDERRDRYACMLLSTLLGKGRDETLLDGFRGNDFTVVGSADCMESEISSISGKTITAGSSISRYVKTRGCPDIAVTDLDHGTEDLLHCMKRGTVGVIHAHGDNMALLRKFPFSSEMALIGTCQCIPVRNTFNFGGFTDGDRAVLLADHLSSPRITLIGFDFEHPASGSTETKGRKLQWARKIIGMTYESRLVKYGEDNIILGGRTFHP